VALGVVGFQQAALLNQGMKKISLTSRSFVDTGFYDWHI
jgi:hypothetical protein